MLRNKNYRKNTIWPIWHGICASLLFTVHHTASNPNHSGTTEQSAPIRHGLITLLVRQRRKPISSSATSKRAERSATIVNLQWVVAIAISYLILAVQDWNLTDATAGLQIIASLLSAVIVQRIPEGDFHKPFLHLGLLVFDSLLIVSAMVIREQTAWDLLLLFFFCVFIAAIADNLIQVGIASLLLTVVFLLFVSPSAKDALSISPDLLVRVPFMFGISLFYGYMSTHFKEEKRRMEKREETLRLKRQFAAAVAHDIKTPLNIILGHAELLGGEYWHQEHSTQRAHSLRCIQQNVDRIVQLVTDFLTVSKLETLGLGLARARVQMNIVIEEVVAEQMITAHEKNLTITTDLDRHLKPVWGDHDQLRRVLGNLVSNAIKFTPANGSINVTSRMTKEEVSIGVADTGPGIPKEDRPRLFSQFTRLNEDANTEGNGLGLFIVKTIVEAHHGRVQVDSDSAVGSTFTIVLPACKPLLAADDHHAGNNAPPELEALETAASMIASGGMRQE